MKRSGYEKRGGDSVSREEDQREKKDKRSGKKRAQGKGHEDWVVAGNGK